MLRVYHRVTPSLLSVTNANCRCTMPYVSTMSMSMLYCTIVIVLYQCTVPLYCTIVPLYCTIVPMYCTCTHCTVPLTHFWSVPTDCTHLDCYVSQKICYVFFSTLQKWVQYNGTMVQYNGYRYSTLVQWYSTWYNGTVQWYSTMVQYNDMVVH